jgi:Flp pilus assembly protein TadG
VTVAGVASRSEGERRTTEDAAAERGAAIVDFALVGGLLTVLFVVILQLALILHVRNVLVDCASQGARLGALADRDPQAGARRTRELIRSELADRYAEHVSAGRAVVDGLVTVEVRVEAPLPVIGLFGVGRTLSVSGHALAEQPTGPEP